MTTTRPAPSAPASDTDLPTPFDSTDGFVVFTVDTHGYALPVANVRHVLPYPHVTRIPTDAAHIVGVFHHAGRILALWDLHALFGADGPPPTRPQVVVVEHGDEAFGLVVDQVDEVVAVRTHEVVPSDDPILQPHVRHLVRGWLRVPDEEGPAPDEAAPRPEGPDTAPLSVLLAAAGRPDRGAAVLALLAPVHLLDIAALHAHGTGRSLPQEAPDAGP